MSESFFMRLLSSPKTCSPSSQVRLAGARCACLRSRSQSCALPDELKSASSTVYLVGNMPQGLRTDWLGAYDQLARPSGGAAAFAMGA